MACSWYSIKDKDFMADISPLGRIPVLYDGGAHIYESGAPTTTRSKFFPSYSGPHQCIARLKSLKACVAMYPGACHDCSSGRRP